MGDGRIFLKIFHASLFNVDLSNEPNFGRINLAGQYLKGGAHYQKVVWEFEMVPVFRVSTPLISGLTIPLKGPSLGIIFIVRLPLQSATPPH
jgi:hypothetical protein